LLVNQEIVFGMLLQTQEYYELLTRYEPLVFGVENPRLVGRFYASLAYCQWYFGSFDSAIQSSLRGVELCGQAEDAEGAGGAYWLLLFAYAFEGKFEQVVDMKNRDLPKVGQKTSFHYAVYATGAVTHAYAHLGRWTESLEIGEEMLRLAQESSDDTLISWAAMNISWYNSLKGDIQQAVRYGKLAAEKARTPLDRALAQAVLGWASCYSDNAEQGVEILEEVYEMVRSARFSALEVFSSLFLTEGYLRTGSYPKAKRTAERTLEKAKGCRMQHAAGWNHRLLGEIALKIDANGATPCFKQAISTFQELGTENDLALAYSGMGRFHKQQGNADKAREYLTKALEIFERLGTLIEPDTVRQQLAELPQ
jgi:tetratricopeptide (TPR) repeat protein